MVISGVSWSVSKSQVKNLLSFLTMPQGGTGGKIDPRVLSQLRWSSVWQI